MKVETQAKWRRAQDIYCAALESQDGGDDVIARACADDTDLREMVDKLIGANENAPTFLTRGAATLARPLLTEHDAGTISRTGQRVGPYRLCEQLGRGGMGVVYRATRVNGDFDHEVAIKLLRNAGPCRSLTARFEQEKRVLAALNHPGIARLFDGGWNDDGQPYIVMEYVRGVTLHEYCDRECLTLEQRFGLLSQVAAALHHAHRNLIVHRDLKPSNILVNDEGQVKLLDFGIAKLLGEEDGHLAVTRDGEQILTPMYAAPEQIQGGPVGVATDIYQLGLAMFEIICGSRPFDDGGGHLYRIARQICEADPAAPSQAFAEMASDDAQRCALRRRCTVAQLRRQLRGDPDAIILHALRKRPSERYSSMEAVSADIAAHLESRPVLASSQTTTYRASRFVKRHRFGVAAAASLLLTVVVYVVTLTIQSERIAQALAKSTLEARKAAQVSEFLIDLFGSADPDAARGQNISARQLLDAGERRVFAAMPDAPLIQAHMMQALGSINYSLGAYRESAALLNAARDRQRNRGDDPAALAHTLTQLGIALTATDDFAAAQSALEEAVALWREQTDKQAQLAEALNALALLLRRTSDLERAGHYFAEAIAILRTIDGGRNQELAVALNNLATLHYRRGEYRDAESLMSEAVNLQERVLGADHSYFTVSLNNLAKIQTRLGRYDEAQVKLQRALMLQQAQLGSAHPYVARTLHSLGVVAHKTGRLDEARASLEEALAIQRHSDEKSAAATTMRALGKVHMALGDLTRAGALFDDMLRLDREVYPADSYHIGRDLAAQAELAGALGDINRAEALFQHAFALLEPDSRHVAAARFARARVRYAASDLAGATSAARESLRIHAATLPAGHPDIVAAQRLLAEIAQARKTRADGPRSAAARSQSPMSAQR